MQQPVRVEERDLFGDGADDQLEDDDVELWQDVDVGGAAPLVQLVRQHRERQVHDRLQNKWQFIYCGIISFADCISIRIFSYRSFCVAPI